MFPALGATMGSLHPVRAGLKFRTCMNILNNFLTFLGNFGSPPRMLVSLKCTGEWPSVIYAALGVSLVTI